MLDAKELNCFHFLRGHYISVTQESALSGQYAARWVFVCQNGLHWQAKSTCLNNRLKNNWFYNWSTSTCITVVGWIERAGWPQWPKTRWTGLNVFLPLPCFLEMFHRIEWCALSLSMLSNARLCNSAVSKCDRLSASVWSIKDNQVHTKKTYKQNLYCYLCYK